MNELYWITRLDAIHGLSLALVIISAILIILFISVYLGNTDIYKKWLNYSIQTGIILILSCICLCFVPTTKEALIIYGVGGTIDYIKSNDKVKELPDKVIDVLDKWLDEEKIEYNTNNNDN